VARPACFLGLFAWKTYFQSFTPNSNGLKSPIKTE
jgi:hypothetical protein